VHFARWATPEGFTLPDTPESHDDLVAAVDLGSNSFHMVIARQTGHDLQRLDRLREPVRLSAGVRKDGHIGLGAQERALACLQRFGERVRDIPVERVRAVGTNAFRQAKRSTDFRTAAERALGHPIEIISGMEEARLIYLGVAHSTPALDEERLVVDIGGGSTEIIHGHGFEPTYAASRFLGSVTFTREFFADGQIDRERFRKAQTAASQQLQDLRERFKKTKFDRVLGSSGTAVAVSAVLRDLGFSDGRIDYSAMKKLRRVMIEDPSGAWFNPEIARQDRLAVLPGGLCILMAVHRSLGIEEMHPSHGALRDGLLYDQVGRVGREEVRSRTIDRMVERFAIDQEQAARVETSAAGLLDQSAAGWDLDADYSRKVIHWAACLHEAGLSLAHTGYHRHGAYLVANSDMPGFSVDDQALVAAIIRTHRRKIRFEYFDTLASQTIDRGIRLSVLFRLGVLLNRARIDAPPPRLSISENGRQLELEFEPGWLDEHPLTVADLTEENEHLRSVDFGLGFGSSE
jgi:exopolyphosphatase/guanosine-5'-triphosphate,3'-diphosphate pyrophosphatase